MTVFIEKYIPYLHGVLEPYAEVQYVAPDGFTKDVIRDADALIIRTRTTITDELLEGTQVSFVATATIGTDHIHTTAVPVYNAAGCNARAVCDYVEEVLDRYAERRPKKDNSVVRLGVVGYGHIGTLVVEMAKRKGSEVLISDPFKGYNTTVEDLMKQCDILTFHTPLTYDGPYPTYHMVNERILRGYSEDKLIINAARGGIIDEAAALASSVRFAIDCWENEPQLNQEFLARKQLIFASYHIAGYSVQGKRNASQMCLDALTAHFGLPSLKIEPDDGIRGDSAPGWLDRITRQLKDDPEGFEHLRKAYPLR